MEAVTLNTKAIRDAFTLASVCTSKRSNKPALTGVLANTQDGLLKLSSTDGESTLDVVIPCDGHLRALLPTQKVQGILAGVTDETVTIQQTEGGVRIKSKRSKFEVGTSNPDEFPVLLDSELSSGLQVDSAAFKLAIDRTAYALVEADKNYNLNGVYLDYLDGKLSVVGTDGNRMSIDVLEGEGEFKEPVLIPATGLRQLMRVLAGIEGKCVIANQGNSLSVSGGNVVFSTLLSAGNFPKWRKVPTEASDLLSLPCATLRTALDQITLIQGEEAHGTRMEITEGNLRFVYAQQDGSAEIDIPVDTKRTETLRLRHWYLHDFVKHHPKESVVTLRYDGGPLMFECGSNRGFLSPLGATE